MTTGGATFTQIGASNQWQIHSGLDAHNEIITFLSGATIHSTDYLFYEVVMVVARGASPDPTE